MMQDTRQGLETRRWLGRGIVAYSPHQMQSPASTMPTTGQSDGTRGFSLKYLGRSRTPSPTPTCISVRNGGVSRLT